VDLVGTIAAIILLVILGLLQTFHSRKLTRVEKQTTATEARTTAIDRAVNNRPPNQPNLYDLVQTLDMKFDSAVVEIRLGLARHEERDDDRFTELGRILGRLDERSDGTREHLDREIVRLDRRITETRNQI